MSNTTVLWAKQWTAKLVICVARTVETGTCILSVHTYAVILLRRATAFWWESSHSCVSVHLMKYRRTLTRNHTHTHTPTITQLSHPFLVGSNQCRSQTEKIYLGHVVITHFI